jgi:SAM-dependent methyltransferase
MDCPACGGRLRPWRRATAADPQLAGRELYELARCEACGTAVTLQPPTPERAAALYEDGTYAPAAGWADRALAPLRRATEADRMRFLRGLEPGARVIELGAGDGRFVARMRAAGLAAEGAEPSPAARARAAQLGVELAAEPDLGGERPPAAIVLWHVLEHLEDPASELERVAAALRPRGRLVVAVPNLASLQAQIGGDRWFHQDVPRHRTQFTAAGLEALLGRRGFAPPRLSHLLLEQNALGMWQTLLNLLTAERNVAFRLLKRDFPLGGSRARLDAALTVALSVPALALSVPLELAAGLARRGGSIVAVSERAG